MINKTSRFLNIDEQLDEAVKYAKEIYFKGNVFIYPTDTIYGFGANPFNEEAISRINEIKGREFGKMYIMLINNIDNLLKYVEIKYEKHMDFLLSIWPNPVSVVLTLNTGARNILKNDTAAFRIPNHRFCLKLLNELNMPLVSTSVNRRNEMPFTEASLIIDEFENDVDAIFYSKKKSYFEASTLIDLSSNEPKLLREGKIKFKDLLKRFDLK